MVHVFNPEGIGGLPVHLPVEPAARAASSPAIALQRAMAFTAATESKGLHDMAFWIGKASSVLASLLHAAALDGRTMHDVYQWAHGIDDDVPERSWPPTPAPPSGWLGPIREVRRPGRTADSIRMTVTRALAWLADPAVAAATSPGPGEGFDVAEFVSGRNTLYMIGAGRDEAPIAPLFRAFAEYVHARAAFVGSLHAARPAGPADAHGAGRGHPDLPRPAAAVDGRQRRQGHPHRRRLPRPGPARSPLGQRRRPGDLGHRRNQGHPRRRHRPRHPRPALPAVRRDPRCAPTAAPTTEYRRPRPHRQLRAGPGPAARPAAHAARMARPDRARQPVPGHRPAAHGLETPRLPPRPPAPPRTPPTATGRSRAARGARTGDRLRADPAARAQRITVAPPARATTRRRRRRTGQPTRPAQARRRPAMGAPARGAPLGTRRRPAPVAAAAPVAGRGTRPPTPEASSDRPAAGPRPGRDRSPPWPSKSARCATTSNRSPPGPTRSPASQHKHAAAFDGIPELRRQVEQILALLTDDDQAASAGWFWLTMDDQAREDKLGELSDWVEAVLRAQYPDYLAEQIRPCWPNHPEALWELTWLYQLWCRAYLTKRPSAQRRRRLARPLGTRRPPPPRPGHGPM